jgi:hypothetical protein
MLSLLFLKLPLVESFLDSQSHSLKHGKNSFYLTETESKHVQLLPSVSLEDAEKANVIDIEKVLVAEAVVLVTALDEVARAAD